MEEGKEGGIEGRKERGGCWWECAGQFWRNSGQCSIRTRQRGAADLTRSFRRGCQMPGALHFRLAWQS